MGFAKFDFGCSFPLQIVIITLIDFRHSAVFSCQFPVTGIASQNRPSMASWDWISSPGTALYSILPAWQTRCVIGRGHGGPFGSQKDSTG